jgi:uncharacterized protein YrrD
MFKLELKEGAGVYTPGDEQIGEISGFVLDAKTNEVTHLVVKKSTFFPEDKVLPFDMVRTTDDDKVILNQEIEDVDELPSFEETHYVRTRGVDPDARYDYGVMPAYYWYPPHGFAGYPVGYYGWPRTETVQNIPEGTSPLEEGANVMSSDGEHVGDMESLFVDGDTNQVTHFLISQGLLFKDRRLVPAHWVNTVSDDKVHLSVSKEVLESLPAYEK